MYTHTHINNVLNNKYILEVNLLSFQFSALTKERKIKGPPPRQVSFFFFTYTSNKFYFVSHAFLSLIILSLCLPFLHIFF